MSIESFSLTLRDLEVFRGLPPDRLEVVTRAAERVILRAGQPIIEAGKAGDAAFVLIDGAAEIVDDAAIGAPGQRLVSGSLIGEMAMLIEHEHRVTVMARSQIRALRITRAALQSEMLADPGLAEHFVARIASRLTRLAVEMRRIDQMLALAADPEPATV